MGKDNYIISQYEKYLSEIDDIKKEVYIKTRVIDQIAWYDKKAADKQKRYKMYSIISITLTAIIPVISIYTGFKYGIVASTLIALFGAIATIISAAINLCEYQKLWIEYRSNCEILKSLLHKYFTGVGVFSDLNEEERFNMLVEMTEDYLIMEFKSWSNLSHSGSKN